MNYEVRKPFNTVNRRFRPGSGPGGTVSATDDLAPHTIKTLLAKNFIREKVETPVPAAKPAAPVRPPSEPEPSGDAQK